MLLQRRIGKTLVTIAISGTLLLQGGQLLPAQAAKKPFKDVGKHWAAAEISHWQELGLAGGYSDSTFRPTQAISRGEFLAFANRAFGFVSEATISFPDVSATHKWRSDIAKAVSAGYATAYPDGNFRPNKALSRLEAGQMLYAILHLTPVTEDKLSQFKDLGSLSADERSQLNAVVSGGYLGGLPNNSMRPQASLSRAEMIVILNRAAGDIYNQPLVFGPEQGNSTLRGNATVSRAATTLRNLLVQGDLFIAPSVGDGEVYLENVTVKGTTWVAAGGADCLRVSAGSRLAGIVVTDSNNNVQLVFDDSSSVNQVVWRSGGSYQGPTGSQHVPAMQVADGAAGQSIRLAGAVGDLAVQTAVSLELSPTATVRQLTNSGQLRLSLLGTVSNWQANAPFRLELQSGGQLQALKLAATASGSSITRTGVATIGMIDLAAGSSLSVDGKPQTTSGTPPATTPSTPSGGTGSVKPGGGGATPGGGATTPGGGATSPLKQPVRATGISVQLTTGAVIGVITDGVNGTIDLSGQPDSAAIISAYFDAPAGTTLQLTSPTQVQLTSLAVTPKDLLSILNDQVELGVLRTVFTNSVTVTGVASHPDYSSSNVTMTIRLK